MTATAAGILDDTNESNDETPFERYRAGHAAVGCLGEVGSCERAANPNDLFLECVDPDQFRTARIHYKFDNGIECIDIDLQVGNLQDKVD